MNRKYFLILFLSLSSALSSGCAFFNTFYHARKAYNNGTEAMERNKEQIPPPLDNTDVPLDRFSREPKTVSADAKQFFDAAIEKANKVVVLYPKSGWAEDATLLLGKAHYLRANPNDLYDAKNRLEVFLTRYPDSKKTREAKLWYGKALLKLDKTDDAEDFLRQVAESSEQSKTRSEALILLGDIAMQDENYSDACEYYAHATEAAGDEKLKKESLYKAFYAYYRVSNYTMAIGYANVLAVMDLNFNDRFDVLFMKARAMKLAGQYTDAIRILDGLIGNQRYKSYFVKAEFEIADVLRMAGKNAEAVKQFNYVIETYNNQLFSGDSYYLLGLINDMPVWSQTEQFLGDTKLAERYYSLVKTKYPNSTYFLTASERYDYLTKMDVLKGSIQFDEILLQVIEQKINDSNFVLNIETYFPSAVTISLSDTGSSSSNAEHSSIDQPKKEAAKEASSVEIANPELEEKMLQVQVELLDAGQLTDRKKLLLKLDQAKNVLAADLIMLADYFFFNLSNYDSADYYYQYAIDHFKDSPNLEFALYGHARVQQKKGHPNYRSFYEYAYNVFPDGRLANIGRKFLGIKENTSDSVAIYFALAEEYILQDQNFAKAIQYYTRVALKDSADRKLQALYAMGLLYEKRMDNPAEAFRAYNTLLFAGPNSDYAKKVKPKVDAYATEKGITKDSLVYWIDRDILKIVVTKAREDTAKIKAVPQAPMIDSTRSRLPEGLMQFDDDDALSDSTQANKNRNSGKKKPSNNTNHDMKEKETNELIKDE